MIWKKTFNRTLRNAHAANKMCGMRIVKNAPDGAFFTIRLFFFLLFQNSHLLFVPLFRLVKQLFLKYLLRR